MQCVYLIQSHNYLNCFYSQLFARQLEKRPVHAMFVMVRPVI